MPQTAAGVMRGSREVSIVRLDAANRVAVNHDFAPQPIVDHVTAIPAFTAKHVRAAIAAITRDGVPRGRGSTKFCVVVDSSHFPPKYVVALAASAALGRTVRPNEFSGGSQTNSVLKNLDFEVVPCTCGAIAAQKPMPTKQPKRLPLPRAASPRSSVAKGGVSIVRVAMRGRTPKNVKAEERILLDAFGPHWPDGTNAKFVLTPGGFVHGKFPSTWRGPSGWSSSGDDMRTFVEEAERQLARVVTDRVYRAAVGKANVLSVGIDLEDENERARVELVAVFDLAKRRIIRWTGKSYPTPFQEHTLVHVVDLDTHLLEIAGERVLVLGCHDLNMFSPRARANQSPDGPRRARCDQMKLKVKRFKPTVVLQHPHSTDTENIWRMPWMSLARDFPSVHTWASGVAHYRNWGGKVRSKIDRVLALTKSDEVSVRDIVLRSSDYE